MGDSKIPSKKSISKHVHVMPTFMHLLSICVSVCTAQMMFGVSHIQRFTQLLPLLAAQPARGTWCPGPRVKGAPQQKPKHKDHVYRGDLYVHLEFRALEESSCEN